MKKSPYYHIGIVVDNLEKAIDYYSTLLNTQFTEIAETALYVEDPHTNIGSDVTLRVVYSRKNVPYIELIEATGEGVFSKKNSGQILYYGLWEKDVAGRIQKLKQQGIDTATIIYSEKGKAPSALITEPDEFGARMEYVDAGTRGYITAWAKTGKLPTSSVWSLILAGFYSLFYGIVG